jgi:protein TonB
MTAEAKTNHDRAKAAIPTLAVHLLLALALMRSLGVALPEPRRIVMALIDLAPPPPPQVKANPPVREKSRRPEGAASPPNLESRPTEIVAPPVVPLLPPPVVTAPVANVGADPSAGSADVPGPGTGSGGEGNGTGSGGRGNGPGGGGDGDGDGLSPPRRIRGNIRDSDYPPGLGESGIGGTVSVIYTVETDGRATNCRITNSSGNDILDDTTCRLIEQRFHFNPSHDRAGRPIRSRIVQDHYWETQDEEPEREPERPVRRRWRPF